jgi:hypothetical protein
VLEREAENSLDDWPITAAALAHATSQLVWWSIMIATNLHVARNRPLVCKFGRLFAQSGKCTWYQPEHPPGATGQMAPMSKAGFQHKLAQWQPGDEQLLRPLDAAVHHVLILWDPESTAETF